MKRNIAGHEFKDDNIDSPCIKTKTLDQPCCMTRAVLFQLTPEDVGKSDLAHLSYLSQGEYADIVTERTNYEQHCTRIMEAIRSVSG